MRRLNILRRAAGAFFAFLLLFTQLGTFAAVTSYDPSLACTLRVKFRSDDPNAQGVRFRIYRVADISSDGYYSTAGDFTDYDIHFGGLDSAGWAREAKLLLEHIRKSDIQALAWSKVDETGMAVFQGLQNGLYLVEGRYHIIRIIRTNRTVRTGRTFRKSRKTPNYPSCLRQVCCGGPFRSSMCWES